MKTKFVEFGGERYEVPAGKSPRSIADAQRMQRALRASEKPAEAPSGSSGTSAPRNSQRAPTASPRPSQRPSRPRNSQDVSGDPRTSGGYNRIGASNPPVQANTQRLPSTPSGSGVTRTAGSMADTSPSRRTPARPQTPDAPESNLSTKQSRYKPMVRKEDIKTFAQWMNLSPEQRRQAGLPSSQIGARRYFAGLK